MEAHDILFKGYRFRPKKVIKMNLVSFIGDIISPKIKVAKKNIALIIIKCLTESEIVFIN